MEVILVSIHFRERVLTHPGRQAHRLTPPPQVSIHFRERVLTHPWPWIIAIFGVGSQFTSVSECLRTRLVCPLGGKA